MKLTDERRAVIDAKSYTELLEGWRFAPVGSPWFQDETGDYWGKRMKELRSQPGGNDMHFMASKEIGWDPPE